ncbi:hypothetical protein AVEN_197419-1 [Araneus ventricosus]|uniref:Tc1-like transposase DDE domain-containing protein n=1 Tax=Araneus ventricosus TaxID=182803 RepID=A0A4Y2IBF7_ARAVE|nr:hypothetical protein AVEN_197419-1 [Araneus ventricosus]
MGAEFLFMDDNARPHRSNIVDECLQSEDITRMDWPAYSPDLNPIEHVWDMLGRRIAARQPPPTCLPELRRALLDEWCNIPQDQIDNLILSMPRRYYENDTLCDVQKWCRESHACGARKGPKTRIKGLLQRYIVGASFERMALDILGPFPVTAKGNRYVLVLMAYFPKWPEEIPITDQEASTVLKNFFEPGFLIMSYL